MSRKLAVLACALSLAGCVRREQYSRPAPPVPGVWPQGSTAPAAPPVKWREYFTSAGLQSLIELALANNRDLRMAALSIERAQAVYGIQRVQLYPTIGAAADAQAYRLPGKMTSSGQPDTQGQITAGAGIAAWEVDLFGRLRSLRSVALEQFLASEQARNSTQIALVGAIVNSYLALAADRENLRLAEQTLETQQAFHDLILKSRNAGMASDLDVRQAESQVEAARTDIARYSGLIATGENALALLAGAAVPPELLPKQLGPDNEFPEVPAGLPADVLLNRPDILAAEHQLKAADANIGVARAAFFPRISLTAAAGVMSGDLANLFTYNARTWNFAPNVSLPIFDYGARRSQLKVTQLDRDMAIAAYEKTIQTGFREVSDSLALRMTLTRQQTSQEALVHSLSETYRLSEARYKAGIDSYLSVLVAQRSLYGSQQVLIGLRYYRLSNLVNLYKALGGGM